jgi:tetratricopeptide (TPR) repeat protein
MKSSVALTALLLWSVASSAQAVAGHGHGDHDTGTTTVELGVAHFPNSGAAIAQTPFLRGLLQLHSFEYDAARRAFQEAQRLDPGFALAYWGEALSYNQTLWGEQDLPAARAALAKLGSTPAARLAKAPTPRERGYLSAVEQLYGEGDKPTRDANFSAALGTLAATYPQDLDARSFYALSLLGLTGTARNEANYMRAAAEAEAVYEIDKHHPGALHYLIHSYDDPVHAPLGIRAARLYGQIALGAPHAQHMPSHIFFALGLWDDAIESNAASLKTTRSQGSTGYHSLLWLTYAYLQEGKRPEAEALIRSVAHDVAAGATKDNRARLSYARATWLVETRGAEGAEARTVVDSSGIRSINYFAAHDFARGITAGANADASKTALADLRARIALARQAVTGIQANWLDSVTPHDLEQADLMAAALEGSIRFYAGDHPAGLAQLREAIAAADRISFEFGPPWSVKPFDELLGDLLLADGRRDEAAAAFRKTLATYPNRRLAVEGLAASTDTH